MIVAGGAVSVLVHPLDDPFLGLLDGVCFLARDEQLGVPTGGIVQHELSTRVLRCCEGSEDVHLLDSDGV